jgi:hypothetical protein
LSDQALLFSGICRADPIGLPAQKRKSMLRKFRLKLEDLCGGLGVTDAVSGPVVIEIT